MAQHLTCDICGTGENVIRNWSWKREVLRDTGFRAPLVVALRITTDTNAMGNPMGDVDLCLDCRRTIVTAALDEHPDGKERAVDA